MKAILAAALAAGFLGHFAPAVAAEPSCSTALHHVEQAWERAGYPAPAKPSQARVVGSDGTTISGADYDYVVTQLRLAVSDCRTGSADAAMQRITAIQNRLETVDNRGG